MESCRNGVQRQQLTDPMMIYADEPGLDFSKAKALADRAAKSVSSAPMLLAWFDAGTGRYSPPVECCGEDKPSWLIYAESRGGNITVDVNDESYVFVYLDVP